LSRLYLILKSIVIFDYNVFTILTPKENNTITAFDLLYNTKRFYKGVSSVTKEPTINSQEPTPSLTNLLTTKNQVATSIVLTLNKEVKDPKDM
jgi:hypothetical protein